MSQKYKEFCEQYTIPSCTRTCTPARHDKESDSNEPPTKRKKDADKSSVFAVSFYHYLLGHVNHTNADATVIRWQPKELLHKLLGATVINSTKTFETQLNTSRQRCDDDLIDSGVLVYSNIPNMTTIITQALTKKLQLCYFSTVSTYAENQTAISISCFTPLTLAGWSLEALELEDVNIDKRLD